VLTPCAPTFRIASPVPVYLVTCLPAWLGLPVYLVTAEMDSTVAVSRITHSHSIESVFQGRPRKPLERGNLTPPHAQTP